MHPPHLEMVNNILNESKTPFHKKTNINTISTKQWRQLRNHLGAINEYPHCVCYNVSACD